MVPLSDIFHKNIKSIVGLQVFSRKCVNLAHFLDIGKSERPKKVIFSIFTYVWDWYWDVFRICLMQNGIQEKLFNRYWTVKG